MMFLNLQFVFIGIYFVSCLPINYESDRKVFKENPIYQPLKQKQSLESILTDNRDEESMKKIFDIVDDQTNSVKEKSNILKKIEEQTSPQLQQRKADMRKSVAQEVAKKMFPTSTQNEKEMAGNLFRLPPEKLFKTAFDWGIITSTKTDLVPPIVLEDLAIIKDDRDEESMKKVFDIVDDQVNDNEEKKNLLKKIEEQTTPQLKQRKAEIRKSVAQEVAKKMFPTNTQREEQMAENLFRLPPEKLFKTALDWEIITPGKTGLENLKIEKENKVLLPTMSQLIGNQGVTYKENYDDPGELSKHAISQQENNNKVIKERNDEGETFSQNLFDKKGKSDSIPDDVYQLKYGNLKSFSSEALLNKSNSEELFYDGADIEDS